MGSAEHGVVPRKGRKKLGAESFNLGSSDKKPGAESFNICSSDKDKSEQRRLSISAAERCGESFPTQDADPDTFYKPGRQPGRDPEQIRRRLSIAKEAPCCDGRNCHARPCILPQCLQPLAFVIW